MRTILLTGATGFVGRNLIPRILGNGSSTRLLLLIRGSSDREVKRRLEQLLHSLSPELDLEQARRCIRTVRGSIRA